MRWFPAVFVLFIAVGTAAAQAIDPSDGIAGGIPVPIPPIAPIPSAISNSIIDHNGRLFIFDVSYENAILLPAPGVYRFSPTVKTRVTIIENDASKRSEAQYNGAFQFVGVGRYAVYAIVTDYTFSAASAQTPIAISRRLVALGSSFPILPSLDVPLQADVKVSAVGDDGAPDTIAFVDMTPSPRILEPAETVTVMPAPSIPTRLRSVQIFRFDGRSFTRVTPAPIPIP